MTPLICIDVEPDEPEWASLEQRDAVCAVVEELRGCDPGDPIVFVPSLAVRIFNEGDVPIRKGALLAMKCYVHQGA
jgi:hypothetical protein